MVNLNINYQEYADRKEKSLLLLGYELAGEVKEGASVGKFLDDLIREEFKSREFIIFPDENGVRIYTKRVEQPNTKQVERDTDFFLR